MATRAVPGEWIEEAVCGLLVGGGLDSGSARVVASSLADADRRGVPSHGSMLTRLYLDRLRGGSVSNATAPRLVSRFGAVAVLDGRNCFGQLSGDAAIRLGLELSNEFGVGVVTVRHAFHFGEAYRYARAAAEAGRVAIVASNTRPLLAAVGSGIPQVGNNPLAIGVPRHGGVPFVLDFAMSEVAMGRVRRAADEDTPIPADWAVDGDGNPTTDPRAAIAGALQAFGGHKGLGLALAIEALTGGLAGGAMGPDVQGLYADPTVPYDCSHFFALFAVEAFGDPEQVQSNIDRFYDGLTVRVPGLASQERINRSASEGVPLSETTIGDLHQLAEAQGRRLPEPGTRG